jgi:hypothetical protein
LGASVAHPLIGRYEAGFLFGFRGLPRFVLWVIFQVYLYCGCRLWLVQNEPFHSLAHRFNYLSLKRVKPLENAVS